MNELNRNINRLEMFIKHIKDNYEYHSRIALTDKSLDEIENSIYCLRDYADVMKEMVDTIDRYADKTGYEDGLER